jgi:signal transduction histidine kinase
MGVATAWNGIRLFYGRPARWTGAICLAVAATAFVINHTYIVGDVRARVVVMSAVFSACAFRCSFELVRNAQGRLWSLPTLAATLFAVVATTLAARAVDFAISQPEPDVFARTTPQAVHYLAAIVSNIFLVGALLMTATQRLQRQLEERNAELQAAHARAEDASRAKSAFLATVSHELRTPLNAIIGFSDIQRRELFGPLGHPRYREYASDIHGSGMHLLDLITAILDISKVEAKKLQVEPVRLDARDAVEGAARLVREVAGQKRIVLALELPTGRLGCFADPKALKQMLLNLLSNAVKFTPDDGAVTVTYRPLADGGAEFVVRDTGIGIAAADLPRLMRPFEQATQGYARQNGGTGLGLPLVDSLARLHGGTLRIDSAPGEGTIATIRLPGPAMPEAAAA